MITAMYESEPRLFLANTNLPKHPHENRSDPCQPRLQVERIPLKLSKVSAEVASKPCVFFTFKISCRTI